MATFPFTPPSAEADVLLTCARVHLLEGHTRHLRKRLAHPLDWNRLVPLAARHGLLPLLARHLEALEPEALPTPVREHLRAHRYAVALRNLSLSGELLRVLRLFDKHGIPVLPFKGPTLGQLAYGDPALREFGDLDLLLQPRDVSRTRSLLAEQGYCSPYALTPAQEAAYLRSLGQLALVKPEGCLVELHETLAPRAFVFPLDLATMWPRCRVVKLTGQPVPCPGAEDMLLILCMHGAKHLWKNLGWICDVAELLRRHNALNWGQVQREARRLGSERLLWLGVQLAEHVLQAPLPADVSCQAKRDKTARLLAEMVLEHLFDEKEWRPRGWESATFHLRLRERQRDGVRYCLSLLFAPTLADWKSLPLPAPLAFVYYGIRPVRLLGKYLRSSAMPET